METGHDQVLLALGKLTGKVDALAITVEEIKIQTTKTNGRVTSLETTRTVNAETKKENREMTDKENEEYGKKLMAAMKD